jgi:hypothetical protein
MKIVNQEFPNSCSSPSSTGTPSSASSTDDNSSHAKVVSTNGSGGMITVNVKEDQRNQKESMVQQVEAGCQDSDKASKLGRTVQKRLARRMRRNIYLKMDNSIHSYAARRGDFAESHSFGREVQACLLSKEVQQALKHGEFSLATYCTLVVQRRVTDGTLLAEFLRLEKDPQWREKYLHEVTQFLQWVFCYVMEGVEDSVVMDNLLNMKMTSGELVQDFARRVELQATIAGATTGCNYTSHLPRMLVFGLPTYRNGYNLRSLVITKLNERKVAYYPPNVSTEPEKAVRHWLLVCSLAVEVAGNPPKTPIRMTSGLSARYTNQWPPRATRSTHEDSSGNRAVAKPVEVKEPNDKVSRNRSKSPFQGDSATKFKALHGGFCCEQKKESSGDCGDNESD